jgi:hypothetical protein
LEAGISFEILLVCIIIGLLAIWAAQYFFQAPQPEAKNVVYLKCFDQIPLQETCLLLQSHRIDHIYFLHGTFTGVDPLGTKGVPYLGPASQLLSQVIKWQVRGKGTIEKRLVDELSKYIATTAIDWSGENHHLGRLKGAMHFLEQVEIKNSTILVVGHSHAAQIMAMVQHMRLETDLGTKLLAYSEALGYNQEKLTMIARKLRTIPIHWITLGSRLRLDFPVPDTDFLCHFLNIRDPSTSSLKGLLSANQGDLVQGWAIEGSDFVPTRPRDAKLNGQLSSVLDKGWSPATWLKNVNSAPRIQSHGISFLLDYQDSKIPFISSFKSLWGHGVYFSERAISFQLYQYILWQDNK